MVALLSSGVGTNFELGGPRCRGVDMFYRVEDWHVGGSGGMLPQENFESLVIRDVISEHFQGEVSLPFLY